MDGLYLVKNRIFMRLLTRDHLLYAGVESGDQERVLTMCLRGLASEGTGVVSTGHTFSSLVSVSDSRGANAPRFFPGAISQ